MDRVHIRDSDALIKNISVPITMSILATEYQNDGRVQQFQSYVPGMPNISLTLHHFFWLQPGIGQ